MGRDSVRRANPSGTHLELSSLELRVAHFLLQGGEEIGATTGANELVVFDHSGDADAGGGKRVLHADHTGVETDAHSVGKGDVRRKSQRDFQLSAGRDDGIGILTGVDVAMSQILPQRVSGDIQG